ncbi:hypothetical protein SAMN05443428_102165 [Caloramator quimbayensis]|uniref:Uncharacterized protein n=1 Tax=Caloramator quimbayensis TaxID=1147123 RepID=A0A1T4WMQ8_9CLOT|nr:hypothetical protein [Caloramator quimbayensis]SKA78650.1 hypothetical protein SAMN05443428_102165 [Caloramator quimbayensis]
MDRRCRISQRNEFLKNFVPQNGAYKDDMTMSISTGVMAVCEANYKKSDKAFKYMKKMASFIDVAMPGTLSEISPDYGCFLQAWSGNGIVWPLIDGIFGIKPNAHEKIFTVAPNLSDD